ncbi:hypothetical protein, conserved [Eimeria maxima]|uniref:Uncharacterized protein n=1 Tax=Eimeria maxima TaxID=5804 RepID=U6MC90_EIMMA|nr:hypothetical protein, conserved [Eimeria maxima]CDJ61636.1 hypothetical protein, conserved [Eimeria maxima]
MSDTKSSPASRKASNPTPAAAAAAAPAAAAEPAPSTAAPAASESPAAPSPAAEPTKPPKSSLSARFSEAKLATTINSSSRSSSSSKIQSMNSPKMVSMTSGQFLAYRQQSSTNSLLLPSNFFQSRAEIRTWGEEELTDPSVQPYDEKNIPHPFHTSLPGYRPYLCRYVGLGFGGGGMVFLYFLRIGEESEGFKMHRLPYVNAEFSAINGEATNMYGQAYPYTAYPYGVPRV